jgi:hypothetical protein
MIRREVAKLKYALIIFLLCLILFLAKRDSQVWRDIFKRKSLIYEENGNLDFLKEDLEGLKNLQEDENYSQEAPESTEATRDTEEIYQNIEKPYRTDSSIYISRTGEK